MTRWKQTLAAVFTLAIFAAPALADDIPASLAMKLNRTRKGLSSDKADLIAKWSTLEQRRYLLYVDMINNMPEKLYGEDTVEKLIPAEDYAIIKAWPADDQIRTAQYFKKKGPAGGADEVSDEELEAGIAKLEGEVGALVRLMLPSEQKGYIAVRNRMERKRTDPVAEPAPAEEPAKEAAPTTAPTVEKSPLTRYGPIAAAVVLLIVIVALTMGGKKKDPDDE